MPPAQEPEMAPSPWFDGVLDSEETHAFIKATTTNTPTYQSSMSSPMQREFCLKTALCPPKPDLALR
ncbi:GM19338 [Drosophila sechellia]|uniref:GM19338 n=1 Tax=Drosophila sechellia TaxID=7238 RepID=B4IN38_DROSE|nr:GM19338 [Drosophila sechellia]